MAISQSHNCLRELRKQSGLTLGEVAYAVSIDPSAVARYESGYRQPTFEIAMRFAVLYRVPVAEIFSGVHSTVARRVVTRLKILFVRLRNRPREGFRNEHKLQWLSDRLAEPVRSALRSLRVRPFRVLALDVHCASFGFAVLEDADRLLEWGTRRTANTGKRGFAGISRRLRFLLKVWHPSVVVIRGTKTLPSRIASQFGKIVRAEHLPVRFLKPAAMNCQFGAGQILPQREIVTSLATHFPILAGTAPAVRQFAYENPPYHLSAFMALAAGVAYSLSLRHRRTAA